MSKIKLQQRFIIFVVTSAHHFISFYSSCKRYVGIYTILLICLAISCTTRLCKRSWRSFTNTAVVVLAMAFTSLYKDTNPYSADREHYINNFYDDNSIDIKLHRSRRISNKRPSYVNGNWVTVDSQIMRFRGVNLPAKTPSFPANLINTRDYHQLYESKQYVSFLGRPFSLDEAPDHFQRISKHWGFNLIRLSVTWEAVMHECPGCIDDNYLQYLKELVDMAAEYGLYVIIDPHQDVWSRFTGGDGAPWWTLDAVGFDTSSSVLHDTGSAVLHQHWADPLMPKMLWTTNYWKLVPATMFTLFFGGNDYATGITALNTTIPIQDFLRGHYLEFIDAVARTLKDCPNVLGFGTMNEPSNGFIGVTNLDEIHSPTLHGHALSGFDSMRLGSGETLKVSYFPSHFYHETVATLNPNAKSAYKAFDLDVWRKVGVYEVDRASKRRILLRRDHFSLGPKETFATKYMIPFYKEVKQIVERNNPEFVTYMEPYFDTATVDLSPQASVIENVGAKFGFAPHWYDALTLFIGHYNTLLLSTLVDWLFQKTLSEMSIGAHNMHTIVGETGVPYFGNEKDYTVSMDRTLKAMEGNNLDYVLWCYESKNSPMTGDLWNGEDLSLFSNGKGRGLQAAIRPFPHQYSAGLIVSSQRFDSVSGNYELVLLDDALCKVCTARVYLFVPSCHYSSRLTLTVSVGEVQHDTDSQHIEWTFPRTKGSVSLTISAAGSN